VPGARCPRSPECWAGLVVTAGSASARGLPCTRPHVWQTFAPAGQGLTGNRVLGLGLDRGQPMRLFAWMRAGGLFRSENGADSWTAIDTGETLHRSTALGGQTTLAINPRDPEHVYLGNSSVLQVEVPP